jgi:hypothetical protein
VGVPLGGTNWWIDGARPLVATVKFRYRTGEKTNRRTPDVAPTTRPPEVSAADDAPAPVELKPVTVDRWWRESSYDLWQGLEVKEAAPDTIPGEWLDTLGKR